MERYCVSCKKNISNKNSSVWGTKQNRLMLLSNSVVCSKKKYQGSLKIKKQVD